jgi:pyruvate formate lyase activating enzyme
MIIGGLQKFSLLDYPEQVSAIIFTQGCNFRCGFCYNPMLVWPTKVSEVKNKPALEKESEAGDEKGQYLKEDDLFRFLKARKGKIDGIVISGGEPTIHKDLPEFIKKIKKHGFKIKLDTNGSNPVMLEKLIKESLVDYIAMDMKSSEDKYEKTIGIKIDFNKIEKSVKIIMESGLPYEFRTTLVRGLVGRDEIKKVGQIIKGAERWFLQSFNPNVELLNKEYKNIKKYNLKEIEEMRKIGEKFVKQCKER